MIKFQTILLPPIVIISSGQEAYGTYVLIMSMTLLTLALSHFGFGFNLRRNLPSTDSVQTIKELYFPQLYLKSFFIIFGSLFIYILLRLSLENLNLDPRLLLLGPLCLIATFLGSAFQDYLRYSRRTGWMSLTQLLATIFFICAVLIAYYKELDLSVFRLILIETMVLLIPIFVSGAIVFLEVGISKKFYNKKDFKSDISIGLPEYGRNVFDMLSSTVDRFLIAGLIGTASLSIYQPSMAIITVVLLIPLTISLVSFPNLAKFLDEGNIKRVTHLIHESKITIFYFVLPWCLFCIFLGEELFEIWLQGAVQLTNTDRLIFILGSVGVTFASLFQFNLIVLTGYKLTLRAFKISMVSFFIGIFISTACLYFFRQIFWASLGYCLFQMIAFILTERCIREYIEQKRIFKDLIKVIASSAISIFLIYNLYYYLITINGLQPLISLIMSCLLGAGCYLFITRIMGVQIFLKSNSL